MGSSASFVTYTSIARGEGADSGVGTEAGGECGSTECLVYSGRNASTVGIVKGATSGSTSRKDLSVGEGWDGCHWATWNG